MGANVPPCRGLIGSVCGRMSDKIGPMVRANGSCVGANEWLNSCLVDTSDGAYESSIGLTGGQPNSRKSVS